MITCPVAIVGVMDGVEISVGKGVNCWVAEGVVPVGSMVGVLVDEASVVGLMAGMPVGEGV